MTVVAHSDHCEWRMSGIPPGRIVPACRYALPAGARPPTVRVGGAARSRDCAGRVPRPEPEDGSAPAAGARPSRPDPVSR
ncbi:hypothetical protein TPA0907_21770 [Micromonospora humidisoli]|nr:hypothetical protein TPA0907_21770 [Micromonospora sp. AKA109]